MTGVKKCIICENEKRQGYYILSSFICKECEEKIVQTETNEQAYMFFVKQLGKINSKQNIYHS
ncbi:sigma factor G inhibitor Gin [Caldibacillus thermolactis]|jgi:hypothetical protein|uniref:Sigma factor G inhibitor Gin n=1 Tax=Pallidibacillus thermolactis TaxID=251051 RepID=A0ABT2WF39_9BACI|nr:sigma factor G inhibitor Gin [Pallidibacillus thermolactis]MCU9594307.1 sigma factor G inhibitor Gin [Pallidibacillus thermolactis]MCU9601590.1 sigma factor G inhibitor Gin [Pallidibacillus thermolactis subsp. kokeshiiformis]MED1672539.1 sigma factor G inhibitor Gin [Pallidibacillus thermolactis subsp. kokeshiiformis]